MSQVVREHTKYIFCKGEKSCVMDCTVLKVICGKMMRQWMLEGPLYLHYPNPKELRELPAGIYIWDGSIEKVDYSDNEYPTIHYLSNGKLRPASGFDLLPILRKSRVPAMS